MIRSIRLPLAVATVLAAVTLPELVHAQVLTEKDAANNLNSAAKSELAALKEQFKLKFIDTASELETSLISWAIGASTFAEVIDDIEQHVNDFIAEVYDCADQTQRNLETYGSAQLATLGDAAFSHFHVGGSGVLDKFLAKLSKELIKGHPKFVKGLKKYFKVMENFDPDIAVQIYVHPFVLPPPPMPNPMAPTPLPKKLAITAEVAGSDITTNGDGVLCVGGYADPAEGDVTVTITDRDGDTSNQVVSVDGGTCRWRACFNTLDEGNYSIDATQAGGQSANGAIGVP